MSYDKEQVTTMRLAADAAFDQWDRERKAAAEEREERERVQEHLRTHLDQVLAVVERCLRPQLKRLHPDENMDWALNQVNPCRAEYNKDPRYLMVGWAGRLRLVANKFDPSQLTILMLDPHKDEGYVPIPRKSFAKTKNLSPPEAVSSMVWLLLKFPRLRVYDTNMNMQPPRDDVLKEG